VIENEWLLVLSGLRRRAHRLAEHRCAGRYLDDRLVRGPFRLSAHRPSVPAEDVQADLNGPVRPAAVNSREKGEFTGRKGRHTHSSATTNKKGTAQCRGFQKVVMT
jgi:hypothetical protein